MKAQLAAACLAAASVAAVAITPADGAPMSACTATRGTVVAADFAHWGGPIVRGCGIDQRSGYTLLHAAGFTTAGDEHDGAAFICRLGDRAFRRGVEYPTPSEDACIVTPPASAYWSYWVAPAGQDTWTYSALGPTSDAPRPGEVELWTFGTTKRAETAGREVPAITPDSLRGAGAAPRSVAPAIISAQVTRAHSASGSAIPLVVCACLVALLLTGAGRAERRRRQYG